MSGGAYDESGYVDEEELEEMPETERELAEDAQWKLIQKNTFTRWANEHLKTAGKSITDIQFELSDGLRLTALIEVLAGTKFKSVNKKPNFRTQKLENVTNVLRFLEEDEGIRLVNIDSSDIVDCKMKLILGLIWTLILHYSISMPMWEGEEEPADNEKGKGPTPKQRLLGWVNSKMPDKPIRNFTTDWNDGTAIGALVDAVAPGLCPDWEDWNPKNAVKNAKEALDAAQQWLDVPQLIKPEEMVNPKLDEKAMMTYLSQFPNAKLKPGAPLRPKTNPARVRAYGPGVGFALQGLEPEGNTVGAPARFTVDTFSAGKATLEIIVLNPRGQKEACDVKFNDDRNLTYSCAYVPKFEGEYRVIIKYGTKEIPKSPFSVKVEGAAGDPKKVTAQGPGIEPVGNSLGKRTFFNIFLNGAGRGNVDVIVLDPQSRRDVIKPRITKQSEDCYLVEYTPREQGLHSVNVFFAGQAIPKSPFGVEVGAKEQGAKRGDVEPPAMSEPHPGGVSHGGITPQGASPLKNQPKSASGAPVPGKIQPQKAPGVQAGAPTNAAPQKGANAQLAYATGRGIQPAGIRVRESVEFQIHTENAGTGDVKVKIIGPGGIDLPCQVKKVSATLYVCTYVAQNPGKYVITVQFSGAQIQKSPFNVEIGPYKESKIRAYGPGLESGVVGQPCTFTVVTNGETGSLGFSIDGPSEAKIECKDNGDGSADVTYLPTVPGEYAVHILCNDEDIPKSPYTPMINPAPKDCQPGKVKAYGPGLQPEGVKLKVPTDFTVDPRPAGGKATLVVTCQDANGEPVPVQVTMKADGTYACRYVPQKPEKHTVWISYAGITIPSAPFRINVGGSAKSSKPENVRVYGPGIESATRNVLTFFTVDMKESGPGDISVIIKEPNGQTVPVKITDNKDGTSKVEYTPKFAKPLTATILFNSKPIPQSPFNIPVNEGSQPEKVKVYGPGIESATQNVPTTFTVDCKDAGPGELVVALVDSTGKVVPIQSRNNGDGTHRVDYTPQLSGPLNVNVQYAGRPVPRSPFRVPVKDGAKPEKVKVYGPGIEGATKNIPTSFTVDAKEAGPGTVGLTLTDSSGKPVPAKIQNTGNGVHQVDYTPEGAGPMKADVQFANQPVPGSPFKVDVKPELDLSKVYVDNLEPNVPINVPQECDVIASSLPAKVPCDVAIENPRGEVEKVPTKESVDGFVVPYMLKEPGPHKVHVNVGGKPIPKSPFEVNAKPVEEDMIPRNVAPGQQSAPGRSFPDGAVPTKPEQAAVDEAPLNAAKAVPAHEKAPMFPAFEEEEPSKWPKAQEGSPGFKVKAYGDGLTKGVTNKPNSFTIDSREAPAAPLGVTVEGPSEAKIECVDNGDGTCGVNYVTDEPGIYTVNVLYKDEHIPGSPFKPQVVPDGREGIDVTKVRAYGPGLEPQGVYKQSFAKFTVDAKPIDQKGTGIVKATVTNSKGQKAGVQIANNNDGTYKCSYSPVEEGPHKIDVLYDGTPIPGSPFPVSVLPGCDPSRVSAYGPGITGGRPDEPAVFTVDLDGAGQGGLSLSVEGPAEAKINCSDNKDGTCQVEYLPVKPGQYDVHVKFADEEIPGSPFHVPISDELDVSKVKASGKGLEPGGARKDRPSTFQVDTTRAGFAPLNATVTDQSGKPKPAKIAPKPHQPGVFDVTYVPEAEGPATIDVQFANTPIPESPFKQEVLPRSQPEKVRVYGDGVKPTGVPASLPTRFTIDTQDAGDGDVEVAIVNPMGRPIRPTIEPLVDGSYEVEYQPEDVGPLDIHVRFDGDELPKSPFHVNTVPIGRADLCHFDHPPEEHVCLNQDCAITVNTRDAGRGSITCRIVTPNGTDADIEIEDNGDGTVSIHYTPRDVGDYPIEIKFGGQTIPKGKFHQTAEDDSITPSRAGQAHSIPVDHDGPATYHPVDFRLPVGPVFSNVDATVVTPSGLERRPEIVDNGDGTVTFKYQPNERGIHQLNVTYNGRSVPGSPFKFMVDVIGTGRVTAYGPGLSHGRTGEPAEFTIVTKDAGPGGLALAVEGPSKAEIQCVDNKDGTCSVSYLPLAPGDYNVSIRFQDKHIQGSPFTAKISGDAKKRAQVSMGTASEVPLKISETDISNLTASIKSPSGREEPCVLKRLPSGHLGISFTPKEVGEHLVNVYRAGHHIPNSPFTITVGPNDVANPSRVKVYGDGLERGTANECNQFTVDTREAGYGSLSLSIEGPSKSDIECHDNHDGTCLVTYKPTEPGTYVLNVKYADEHVPGSPFHVDIGGEPSTRLMERITHTREAMDVSHVGSQCELSLKIPGTNPEDMSATVSSPSGVTERCDVLMAEPNNYIIKFVPKEMGLHTVAVRHREVHIPGSPFQFTVGPITEGGAHKVHAAGPGLEQGITHEPNEFSIYTREAGAGGLSIAVEGPSKAEIEFEDRKDGSCGVSYQVTEPGEYLCSIKFNDDHIPDSPFRIPVIPQGGEVTKTAVAALQQDPMGPEVGRPAAITVNTEANKGPVQAIVQSPSGAEQAGIVQTINEDQFAVRFIPKENGPHLINVFQDGKPVSGSPFRVLVGQHDADPGMVHASGEGLVRGKVGIKNYFFVNTVSAGSGALSVTIDGPSKVQLNCHEHDDGYEFTYVPTEIGEYIITIKYGGNFHIVGSPFHAQITSDGGTITETRVSEQQSHFVVETVEKAAAKYNALQSAPPGTARPEKVVCKGLGLKRAGVGELNQFIVDGSQAGNECLFIGIMGPQRPCEEVNIRHIGKNQYAVTYQLVESGRHIIMVKWGDRHVPQSPFIVDVP